MDKLFLICLLIFGTLGLSAQGGRILIDDDFSDWENTSVAFSDAIGDTGNNVDFGNLWISNDDKYLFFRFEVSEEISLQGDNAIAFYLDADNDNETGFSVGGIGAELIYNLGNQVGNVYVDGTTITNIGHADINLVTAPTVTSNQFEIAISRDLVFSGEDLFSGNEIRIWFRNNVTGGDRLPDGEESVLYTINEDLDPLPDFTIDKPEAAQLRILSYNVLRDDMFELSLQGSYRRILNAIIPDIIGFQEIYDNSSLQTKNLVESFLPSASGEQWYHSKVPPDIITISRYPILETYNINEAGSGNGAFLIDLEPATNTKMLLIVAHLPCCNNNSQRQDEIDAIMAFVRNAKDGTGPITISPNDPIVILGDMNLVGFEQQQNTLLTGNIVDESEWGADFSPDWDGTELEDARPLATNTPLGFTWYSPGSNFSPGRLDYVLYSGSVMDLKNSYALFTPELNQNELLQYDLASQDAVAASDHLPIVADFDLGLSVATNELSTLLPQFTVYPNPAKDQAFIDLEVEENTFVELDLIDIHGKVVRSIFNGELARGSAQFNLSTLNLPSSFYICRFKTQKAIFNKKIQIVH